MNLKLFCYKNFHYDNEIHQFLHSSGSGTVIRYGSDFLTNYGSEGSGSTTLKVPNT
jgi:hypothetical protein